MIHGINRLLDSKYGMYQSLDAYSILETSF